MFTNFQCIYRQLRLLDALLSSGQKCWRLSSLCPTCRKSQQLKIVGCFVLHLLNSGNGFVELTAEC